MKTVTITRFTTGDDGTFGILHTESDFICFSGELPWRNNIHDVSCIIAGEYLCHWKRSEKFGMCYHVQDVPGRSSVLFHPANYVGDASKGFKSEVKGCITLGEYVDPVNTTKQKRIWNSKATLSEFEEEMEHESFILRLRDAYLPT